MATAYAALLSLMHNLHLIQNHPRHTFSFENEQLSNLVKCALYLISFMERYDNCHCCREEAAEALERRIARAAHAAEDVIESHVVDQILAGKGKAATPRFLLDLQKVIKDMDFVCRKATQVHEEALRRFKVEQPTHSAATAAAATPPISQKNNRSSLVGFDGVLFRLMDRLTGGSSSRRVIPIAGMAGIGKTTLATNAFQHSYVVHYFDVCLWATISQQYSVHRILSELVSCLKKSTRITTVDELGEELYKSLYGKRYLIVLDDMWSVQAWDEVKFFFPDIGNGSRVVVTTRHSHLEEVGKKIVAKCKGLPLAIVVVGGHLRKSSMALEYWESVANHMSHSILNSVENEQCLNILSLSYSYLPVHLKPCFLYMGVFPEDHRILVSEILQLWIAEGFIKPCNCHSLEYRAGRYLENLIERNLILIYKCRFDGKILLCKIHDLVREMCIKIAKEEELFYVLDTPRANRECRVVINEPKIIDTPRLGPLVRSLMCEGGRLPLELKLLRVVKKVDRALANEVNFQQVNLRYLNIALDYKSYRTLYLPSSISLLWNLQTLKIAGAYVSIIAPYEIWEMLQLRHIEVDPICLLDPLPADNQANNVLVLEELQTLLNVENFRLSEEACRRIPNIYELQVSYRDLGRDCDEARSYYCPHNLGCFHNLDSLVCQFDRGLEWCGFASSLTFPSSLRSLSLSGSRLDWETLTTMVGSLPHLEHLVLKSSSVIGSVWNPVEGGFPRLKSIDIHDCGDLVYWNADKSHFPVLKYIHLSHLSKLDEFPSGIGEIPTLRGIGLELCSMSSTISAMRAVAEQEEQGNEGIVLHVCVQGDEETLESFKEMVEEEGLGSKNLHVDRTSKM
ncbi:hypothetical protein C2S53_011366 [Perilla frutescens var. hirtella]|uniref:NB-ARC domain-containing protein n=1 Tax=Perilla frutescens var. hirtella TaxID=608512 RepID=A0AAD4J8R0_PERFH|nr:hypothetical protein C2S53_011366 [Perilla frutescens var. hirtella]